MKQWKQDEGIEGSFLETGTPQGVAGDEECYQEGWSGEWPEDWDHECDHDQTAGLFGDPFFEQSKLLRGQRPPIGIERNDAIVFKKLLAGRGE